MATSASDYLCPRSSICYVKYKNKFCSGTIIRDAFLIGKCRTLLITSYQVLEISNTNEIHNLSLIFEGKSIENFYLTPDWVKWLWNSPRDEFNVTIIEFSPIALNILSRMKYTPLTAADPIENKKIEIYDSNGRVAHGTIIKINEEKFQFKANFESKVGSPLLNESFNVIGIYTGFSNDSNKADSQITRHAVKIRFLLSAFEKYVLQKLDGKTKNEMWLETIKNIPRNEFEFIGDGEFGKVYKIRPYQNKSSIMAAYIVGGLGFLENFSKDVDCIERESKMFTLLGSHPRIIQFISFVRDDLNAQLMILMEYLEGGSLADKLKDQIPLNNSTVRKYFFQMLEGVSFLHKQSIYHNNLKPSSVLFTRDDNLKISGLALKCLHSSTPFESSYMSPSIIENNTGCMLNDSWSLGAIFVHMVSGKRLNHDSNPLLLPFQITKYQLRIDGKQLNEFLETLSSSDFRYIISRTLCIESKRANIEELFLMLTTHTTPHNNQK